MKTTYKNAAKEITLEQAMWMYKRLGICTVINDGKDITLEIEKEPMPVSK